ncbi:MAG: hypothetical protein SGBAC_006572 [Bacillariaceae sp.]
MRIFHVLCILVISLLQVQSSNSLQDKTNQSIIASSICNQHTYEFISRPVTFVRSKVQESQRLLIRNNVGGKALSTLKIIGTAYAISVGSLIACRLRWKFLIPCLLNKPSLRKLPVTKVNKIISDSDSSNNNDNGHAAPISLILLHGMWHDASFYAELQDILAVKGYTSYAVDLLPGERFLPGGSQREVVRDLEHTLEEINGPCILIGHSQGGLVAQSALQRSPSIRSKTKGVVLMGSIPLGYSPPVADVQKQEVTVLSDFWGFLWVCLFGKLRNARYGKHIFLLPETDETTDEMSSYITKLLKNYLDKTKWTIRTHFAAMVVFLVCAIKLYFFPRNKKSAAEAAAIGTGWSRKQLMEQLAPVFLLMEAFSHGFAGVYHLTVESAETASPLESASQLFGMLSCVIFFLFTVMVVMSSQHELSYFLGVIWRMGISGLWFAVIYAYMSNQAILLGIDLHMYVLVGVCLLLLLAYGIRIFHSPNGTICHFFNKSLSLLILILATAYAHNVYRKCGSYDGYLECFIRCQLPGGLNHTSFYNIAKIFALAGWAVAEDIDPSVSLFQLALGLRTDEATVISDGPDLFESDLDKEDEDDQALEEQNDGGHDAIEAGDFEERDSSALTDIESQPTGATQNTEEMTLAIGQDASSSEVELVVGEEAPSPGLSNDTNGV